MWLQVCFSLLLTLFDIAQPSFLGLKDSFHSFSKPGKGLCTSVECLKSAYELKRAMDIQVDPCEDFHKFACGRFIAETRIPDAKGQVDEFETIIDTLFERGRTLLEEPIGQAGDWELDKIPKIFYRDCMDVQTREEKGLKPALDLIERVGGWAVLGTQASSENWIKLQRDLISEGFAADGLLMSISVGVDAKDNDRRVIDVDQPQFGIAREYLILEGEEQQHPVVKAYEDFFVETVVLFGGDEEDAKAEARKVIEFERKLARVAKSREERRDANSLYNPVVLGEMPAMQNGPQDWRQYLSDIVAQDLPSEEKIILGNPKYLESLGDILEETDSDTVKSYFMWMISRAMLGSLTAKAREVSFNFLRATRGIKEQRPMWMDCTSSAGISSYTRGLRDITSSMYVRRYFKPEAKSQMVEMTSHIREAFKEVLEEVDWMDNSTRSDALKKLENMLQNIGYPDEILQEEEMNRLHTDLNMIEGDFFGSQLVMTKFWRSWSLSRLRSPLVRGDWLDSEIFSFVTVANAFYSFLSNSMVFPAGFLGGMFFDEERPKFMNYGGIGGVIGHEVSHGFDDQGRQTDSEGLLRNWWSPETEQRFRDKSQCVIDQYSNFKSEQVGLNLNGVNGLGENIADIVGFKIGYKGYEKWLKSNGFEAGLPGLPYSVRQMFWLSRARTSCSKWTDQTLAQQILTGVHSPDQFRVNGPLINSEEFARDFRCPKGSKMNPIKKCKVW